MIGRRDNQEDSMASAILDDGNALLLVVADGMGGHESGEIASDIAVRTFVDCFVENTVGALPKRLKLALLMANECLAEQIRLDPELDGMGTTLVAAHIGPMGLHWISVGDSLLLLSRAGAISQLNKDHSMAPIIERRFTSGKLTREEADNHPERNDLLSVMIGLNSPDMIDCPNEPYLLEKGDQIVVASDGLQTLPMDEILKSLAHGDDVKGCVTALTQGIQEKAREYQDNVSIQVAAIA